MSGTLFVVATPIGNLEDITVRALRVLREVSVIAAEDTRRTAQLLARHAITTPTTSLHEHNEASKSLSLVARLERGENVALVSDAGTPTISDPGGRLIRDAIAAGIRVEPIPGASAVMAAMAVAGLPNRGVLISRLPAGSGKRQKCLVRPADFDGRNGRILRSAPSNPRTLSFLRDKAGDCQVVIAREMTKVHEELVRGPISTVLPRLEHPRGEFTVIVEIGGYTRKRAPALSPSVSPQQRRETIAALAKTLWRFDQ